MAQRDGAPFEARGPWLKARGAGAATDSAAGAW